MYDFPAVCVTIKKVPAYVGAYPYGKRESATRRRFRHFLHNRDKNLHYLIQFDGVYRGYISVRETNTPKNEMLY